MRVLCVVAARFSVGRRRYVSSAPHLNPKGERALFRRGIPLAPLFASLALVVSAALLLAGAPNSQALQDPSLSLDMVTTGNTYDETTNTMTLGSIENCLTSPIANPNTHTHTVHLAIENVEDLVGWQARMNYLGDQMRPSTVNFVPFVDNNTGQNISFLNLPIDQTSSVHRDLVTASNIPAGAPGPQTALVGAVFNGEQNFAVAPDTPAKATPDDASYTTTGGGVLASLALQVVGDQTGQPSLFMNLDDGSPNGPGTTLQVFTTTGVVAISPPVAQLGDGYHGEGATCAPLDCVSADCPAIPTPTPTAAPSGTPTRTATRTASPTPSPAPSPTASPTPSPTPVEAGHDARLTKISGVPKTVRLSQGEVVADSANIVVANDGIHTETVGVYVDVSAASGCAPSGRVLQTTITLAAGAKTTISVPVNYSCANVNAADGTVYNWLAVADRGADDLAACGPGSLQGLSCFVALADDDGDDGDNRLGRNAPRVIAQ